MNTCLLKLKRIVYDQYQTYLFSRGKGKQYTANIPKQFFLSYVELQSWYWQNFEHNKMHFAWGLNSKGTNQADYISRKEILGIKTRAEQELLKNNGMGDLCYEVLTKDKFVASSYLLANGIPCINNLGVIIRGRFIVLSDVITSLEALMNREQELFIKNVVLEASEGVIHCMLNSSGLLINGTLSSYTDLSRLINKGIWVVQKKVKSHTAIRAMNSSALNTTRIVTVMNRDRPIYLSGFQAFATGCSTTDSWDKGSIYVGIDVTKECLKGHGYHNLSDPANSISTHHPDSGICFKGYHLPYLKDSIEMCLKAHSLLYNTFIIGWDVAITDDGPLIVEANEKPGMNVVQCVDGGLRKVILASYKNITTNKKDKQ